MARAGPFFLTSTRLQRKSKVGTDRPAPASDWESIAPPSGVPCAEIKRMNCHHIDAPNLRAAVPIRHFVGAE